MKLEKETSGEERPTPSPIIETKGENANKLRKERSKYYEKHQMDERLQALIDKHKRQTVEQRQHTVEEDTKEIQTLERMSREHLLSVTDKMTKLKTKKQSFIIKLYKV